MSDDWRALNKANWDERVPIHLAAESYDLTDLRAGRGKLHPIEEAELPDVRGKRLLHLQCHFGRDTLTLVQRGADVVGVDFSEPAIDTARALAAELGLEQRARFVVSDVYDALETVAEPQAFDLVFITWGTIGWLPDIQGWADTVSGFLKPGGQLYFAEGHPAAAVFDDETVDASGRPGYFVPYFLKDAFVDENDSDYADDNAVLKNTRTVEWMHPVSSVISALLNAGLRLDRFTEHDAVPWRMFSCLRADADGMYRWPDQNWLPLSFSLSMTKTVQTKRSALTGARH
jgi:SAM-dependent methyltransferase